MAILYFTEVLSLNPGLSEAPINRSAPYIFTGDNKRAPRTSKRPSRPTRVTPRRTTTA